MVPFVWPFTIGAACLAALSFAISAVSSPSRPSRRRIRWSKGLAALRALLGAMLALLVFSSVLGATAGAGAGGRWTATIAAGCGLLAVALNAAASLWLLSPWVGADLGVEIKAGGMRGIIREYGWARLQIATKSGWTAHISYLTIALRPFIICKQAGPRWVEVVLSRDHWGDDSLRSLRQSAVLSPFRDPSLPVSVSRRQRVASVRLALSRHATREIMRRHLERALDRACEEGSAPRSEHH